MITLDKIKKVLAIKTLSSLNKNLKIYHIKCINVDTGLAVEYKVNEINDKKIKSFSSFKKAVMKLQNAE